MKKLKKKRKKGEAERNRKMPVASVSVSGFSTAVSGQFSLVQCSFTSTETIRTTRDTGSPGRPPRLSHSS